MKMNKSIISGFFFASMLITTQSCTENKDTKKSSQEKNIEQTQTEKAPAGKDINIKIGEINFSRAINNADEMITIENGKIVFKATQNTDYFNGTDGGSATNSAPILLTKIDNTKPFTFTSKLTTSFTEKGTYNAGVLYVYSNDMLYQKLCFEQDERGKHRVVTVRTINTSDDSNHDEIKQDFVYMKISSDGKSIGSYYSLDNVNWQMVRLYKNSYPKEIFLGISNQSPKDPQSTTVFEDTKIEYQSIKDFRTGI